ncbi:MAG: hypothetical protein IT349_08970 [Candidatus Eisenbacteria bacterium]|nr:hypothetical protein [Candidatus Eisenbacteria bacterium]
MLLNTNGNMGIEFDRRVAPDKLGKVVDVLLERLPNRELVKDLYLDPDIDVPDTIRAIVQRYVDGTLSCESAASELQALRHT